MYINNAINVPSQ